MMPGFLSRILAILRGERNEGSQRNESLFLLWIKAALGIGSQWRRRTIAGAALVLFVASFAIRCLHQVDLSFASYENEVPFAGMSIRYDHRAVEITEGHGIIFPDNQDPSDTSLLARPPGFPIVLAAVYKLMGRSFSRVQLSQNVLNSIIPILIFLITGSLMSWQSGFAAGLLVAVSHQLAYYSAIVLPDALSALPLTCSVFLLVIAERVPKFSWLLYLAGGAILGITAWLRPEAVLLGPFLAIALTFLSERKEHRLRRSLILAFVPLLVVAPITIRNYRIYHQFVLISLNGGITLWEGIGEFSDGRFGAPTTDRDVARQEAVIYNDPRYAKGWATPDGIKRDRDRFKKSLAVIARHPIWYARVMFKRVVWMLGSSTGAPRVRGPSELWQAESGTAGRSDDRGQWRALPAVYDHAQSAVGNCLSWTRPFVRQLQRLVQRTSVVFCWAGCLVALLLDWKRGLLILSVPLYYLAVLAPMSLDFRQTLPIHCFLFILAGVSWVLVAAGLWQLIKSGGKVAIRKWNVRRTQATTGS